MAKMTIAPVSIWVQGQVKIAEVLEVTGIRDDYGTSANNYYELREADVLDEEGNVVSSGAVCQNGNLACSGADYQEWDNSNEWIKSWVAEQLNLEIV